MGPALARGMKLRLVALLFALGACATDVAEPAADLGAIGTKADDARVREVELDLAPGEVRRFRVSALRFFATLSQGGAVPARLSAKHYAIELEGETSFEPELDVAAPAGEEETLRHWTLRVHNLGDAPLRGTLRVESIAELPVQEGLLRRATVTVEPGGVRRLRVRGPSVRAELRSPVLARLSAKHYEIDVYGEPSLTPTVEAISARERNWTIRVENLSLDETLTGELTVRVLTDADALAARWRDTFGPAIEEAGGADGRLSRASAERIARRDDALRLAADNGTWFFDTHDQATVSAARLLDVLTAEAALHLRAVAGPDGLVSLAEADALPAIWRADVRYLLGAGEPDPRTWDDYVAELRALVLDAFTTGAHTPVDGVPGPVRFRRELDRFHDAGFEASFSLWVEEGTLFVSVGASAGSPSRHLVGFHDLGAAPPAPSIVHGEDL